MILINGLTELPVDCTKAYKSDYGWHSCPCYHEATADGPAYCTILALVDRDYFGLDPRIHGCPLLNYQGGKESENITRGSRNDNWTVLRKRK